MIRLDRQGRTEEEFLAEYDAGDYPRPSVAADIVIFTVGSTPEINYRKLPEKELRVLLIRRGGHPYLGKWALPGGFVRPDETTAEAARRELREETGVESGYLEQLYTFSNPGRDPRTWVMSCAHMALLDSGGLRLKAGDDADDACWFCLKYTLMEKNVSVSPKGRIQTEVYRLELKRENTALSSVIKQTTGTQSMEFEIVENDGLAFDHAKIIACGINRLRSKVEYTDLAFNLMPERFTLTELQQVYEIIMGKTLLKAAFRRKVKDLVRETGEYIENSGHRPSQLYRRYWEQEEES